MKIFIDFDDTLFDLRRLVQDVYEEFEGASAEALDAHYQDYRQTGPFTLAGFTEYLNAKNIDGEELSALFFAGRDQAHQYVFADAKAFIESLKSLGHEPHLLSFDAEPEIWQKPKIEASGLAKYFDHIEVTSGSKADALKKLGATEPFVFIDDKSTEIESVLAAFPGALCLKHEPGTPLADHMIEIAAFAHAEELKTLPLPINTSINIGSLTLEDGEQLTVTFGLDVKGVEAFKVRSCDQTDEELMKFTTDHERICLGSYEAWYAKERYPFGLINKAGELAGIAWFGPKEFPLASIERDWHTFAIRMYNPYRGKRLAFPFASFVMKAYSAFLPPHPIWLDTNADNVGAVRLYSKLGFTECGFREDGRVVMKRE